MLWIKEVEMVDSVDDLKKPSLSVRGIRVPDFEVLDARIASALNRIIHNSHFKKKGQSGGTKSPKRGPFLSHEKNILIKIFRHRKGSGCNCEYCISPFKDCFRKALAI